MNKTKLLLITLLFLSFLFRVIRIDYPKDFVFDEVYYAFTAQEYLKGNPDTWVWWGRAPEGRAFAWVNPPLPQEIMAASMFIFQSKEAWTWRLPGVFMGVFAIYLVFKISQLLFRKDSIALLSAFIFSVDGLNFTQSRVGMLDIYLVAFILASLYFFLKRDWFLSAIFFGLAFASKWTAVYLLVLYIILLFKDKKFLYNFYFVSIVFLVYLLVYLPFFLTEHTPLQFLELIKQEVWYHTHLSATHTYASSWWSWPVNLYPVWYFVDYQKDKMANIFSGGNPLVFWIGSLTIAVSTWQLILQFILRAIRHQTESREVTQNLSIILAGFFIFWLPWALSHRIMFLYYFSPAVPFMSIALGYQLNKLSNTQTNRKILFVILGLIFLSFIALYPFLTGIPIPKEWVKFFFLTNLAKNPF